MEHEDVIDDPITGAAAEAEVDEPVDETGRDAEAFKIEADAVTEPGVTRVTQTIGFLGGKDLFADLGGVFGKEIFAGESEDTEGG